MAELRPYPFGALVTRMFRELAERGSIFDLPRRSFWLGREGKDLSVEFHRHRASTPLGPAAGPQSQMAQNLVLSWLGGSRILELKTVQIDDRLRIPRPCIDMQTVGYNIEWSQELRLEESLEEYVKGAMLIRMLCASGEIPFEAGSTDTVFDISVGYDLAGIRSERVGTFLDGMLDCSAVVDRLRREIPQEYARCRDLDFETRLSDSVTLSTFHGCPPDEIEKMILFLLEEKGLHSIVKLNPMLLGPDRTRRLLRDELGYDQIRVPDSAFERDTRWDEMLGFVERLASRAGNLGLGFGVKFTNTLIVENHREFLPSTEKEMYLSGAPLHVLAMQLVGDFRRHFGERVPVSFSAGIDRRNFPDAVALGLVPVTVCSDLLKPGGYSRCRGYLAELGKRMDKVGASDIPGWIQRAYGLGGTLPNTEHYVERATKDPRYGQAQNARPPRKIQSRLALFDCITCDLCVPVCPNAANFTFALPRLDVPIVKVRQDGSRWLSRIEGRLVIQERHQIANFADFCNDCGNCDVFCPEDGGPYLVKPRFFGSLSDWRRFAHLDGFFLQRGAGSDVVHGRIQGRECSLEADGDTLVHSGGGYELRIESLDDPLAGLSGSATAEVDLSYCRILCWIRDAVYARDALNWASCL